MLKPCVRCLGKARRQRAGQGGYFKILQCVACGFNVTGRTWYEAVGLWNGFKVWTLVRGEIDERLFSKRGRKSCQEK